MQNVYKNGLKNAFQIRSTEKGLTKTCLTKTSKGNCVPNLPWFPVLKSKYDFLKL